MYGFLLALHGQLISETYPKRTAPDHVTRNEWSSRNIEAKEHGGYIEFDVNWHTTNSLIRSLLIEPVVFCSDVVRVGRMLTANTNDPEKNVCSNHNGWSY